MGAARLGLGYLKAALYHSPGLRVLVAVVVVSFCLGVSLVVVVSVLALSVDAHVACARVCWFVYTCMC